MENEATNIKISQVENVPVEKKIISKRKLKKQKKAELYQSRKIERRF